MKIEIKDLEIRKENENHINASVDVFGDEEGIQINLMIDGMCARRINIASNTSDRMILSVTNHFNGDTLAQVDLEDDA